MMRSLGVVGFLTAVIGMECVMVWVLLSRAESSWTGAGSEQLTRTAASVGGPMGAIHAEDPPKPPHGETANDGVEVDLGEYTVTTLRLSTNTTLRVDFHLFGLINPNDVDQFNKVWPGALNRFRELVITTVRAAQPADLADPSLALIKRQILEKSNRLFGKPFLQSLIVSNFSLVEQ